MSRKAMSINEKSGERFKKFLKKNNLTQKAFAKNFGYTEQHISYIAQGRRNLTAEMARAICAKYPNTRTEWLLGLDDFESEYERVAAAVGAIHDAYHHITGLFLLHGYTFEEKDFSNADEFTKQIYSDNVVEIKDRSGKSTLIPHRQWRRMISEIDRFIEFELAGLF